MGPNVAQEQQRNDLRAPVEDGAGRGRSHRPRALALVAALGAWWLIYRHLGAAARWLTYSLIGLAEGTHLAGSVEFFLFEVPKVLLLLVLVVFGVGMVRSFFTPERTRALLAGRLEAVGNVLAAALGVVTPFCSCSAVPLFIGFVEAGVPLGVTFSFLIAAPMVNEVAVVLLFGLVGWRVAAIYVVAGLSVAILSGWVIGRLRLEGHVEPWVYEIRSISGEGGGPRLTFADRIDYALEQVRTIVGKVWPFILLGIAAGAGIHGYVPEGALASFMGKEAWWSVPAAVLLGVPMYSNAAGIVPVVEALLGKGAALGTALAFMMSVIALSLPEMIILRKVLKPRLIAAFAGIVALGIIAVGFLFNAVL
ncbi:MAG: permease [Armatimonadetes bacterium]|nr:permease [Armatimonadota bacterium]